MMRDAGLEDCRYHNLTRRHRRRAPRLSVLGSRSCSTIENVLNRGCRARRARAQLCASSQAGVAGRATSSGSPAQRVNSPVARRLQHRRCDADHDGTPDADADPAAPLSLLALAGALRPRPCCSAATCSIAAMPELAQKFRELRDAAAAGSRRRTVDAHRRRAGAPARPLRARGARLGRAAPHDTSCSNVAEYLRTSAAIWCRPRRSRAIPARRGRAARRRRPARSAARSCSTAAAQSEPLMKLRVLRGCSRSSACWSGTGWTTSCAPRICTGRCASCSSLARDLVRAPATRTRGERLRLALEELGPIFVKFGQALSTRRDLLPRRHRRRAGEAAGSRAAVPRRSRARASSSAPTAGRSARCSRSSTRQPLAAASIAQVHAAKLPNGQEVVVKVLRPGMRELIERDLEVLYALARSRAALLARAPPAAAASRSCASTRRRSSMSSTCMREAANASQLQAQLRGLAAAVRARGVLGLLPRERDGDGAHPRRADQRHGGAARGGHGHPNAGGERRARSSSRRCSATTSSTPTCTPATSSCCIDDPAHPRYAAVDFGIVGTLDPRDQHYLAENFLAVFDRDYRRVAALHVRVRLGAARTRASMRWSRAVRTVCEPIFDKPLKEISFGTRAAAAVRDLAPLQHARSSRS